MAQELKNRVELASYLAEYFQAQPQILGAEIGVFTGYYSEILCQAMRKLKLWCVDPWDFGKYKRHEEEALTRLAKYNTVIVKGYSVEESKRFNPDDLDFVYIDAAHDYENVKLDIETWTPKVGIGGVVSGDDFYGFPSGKGGGMQAVTEFTSNNPV